MSNAIRVHVTQEDIEKANAFVREDYPREATCPIALATKRRLGLSDDVYVWLDHVTIEGDYYNLSRKAQQFISDFDIGYTVEPATFVLTEDEWRTR